MANKKMSSFLKFDIKDDLEGLDKLIIEEYTKSEFGKYLNNYLIYYANDIPDSISYFIARFLYTLNSYAIEKNIFYNEDKMIYRMECLNYSNLLKYERLKGKIIMIKYFMSTSPYLEIVKRFYNQKKNSHSSVYHVCFYIKNFAKNNINNSIDLSKPSYYKEEKEILFLPISFCYVRRVIIDTDKNYGEVHLEAIGKNEILEEKIKEGKKIEYDKKEKIMKIKNNDF